MDWLQFISTMTGNIAWPIAVVTIVWFFRQQLQSLATRIQEVSFPGGGARFEKAFDLLRKADQEVHAEITIPESAVTPDDPFLELASMSPEAAVMEAYKGILLVLEEGRQKNLFHTARYTPQSGMWALHTMGLIGNDTFELFRRVQETRNAAVHTSATITTGEAIEYREVCQRLATQIREALERAKKAQQVLS